jgi:exodeoxyribonuclease VII small subunit
MSKLNYQSAQEELIQILEDLENDSIQIDQLSTKIERAKLLVDFCTQKLRDQELKLEKLLSDEED